MNVRQKRDGAPAEPLEKKRSIQKNLVQREREGERECVDREDGTRFFSWSFPQSSRSLKPGGRQERHAFILEQHAMMHFSPAPLLLFIIIPRSSWGSTKTIFIDSGEAYFCLMHCLYTGQQPHPRGNKHKCISVCYLRMSLARIKLKDIFLRYVFAYAHISYFLVGWATSICGEKVWETLMFLFSGVLI